MPTNIIINTSFTATHHWPECPIETQSHLRHPHRHIFHVKMKWEVHHDDRDIEFIEMKRLVDDFIMQTYWDRFLGRTSCEMICEQLADQFNACYVRVMEDNENGAELIRGEKT